MKLHRVKNNMQFGSVADQQPGSGAFFRFTPGSGMGKNPDTGWKISGSGMNEQPRSFFPELRNSFWVKNT
jgi:hypothetical protein